MTALLSPNATFYLLMMSNDNEEFSDAYSLCLILSHVTMYIGYSETLDRGSNFKTGT